MISPSKPDIDFTQAEKIKEAEYGRAGIVILNRNKSQLILECIRSIYDQCYKLFVIVVVDNGSIDNSCELIRLYYPDVSLIENKVNNGVAGGRNIGIQFLMRQRYNLQFILFLDNDTILEENCIMEMIRSFSLSSNIGMVTPKLLRPDGVIEYAGGIDLKLTTGRINNIGSGQKDLGQYDYCSKSLTSSGGIFMIRRELLQEVGQFDEKFNPYGWEDVDISLRVRKKGYKIYYNYKAIVYHKGGKTARGYINEYEQSKVKNYFYLINKHSNLLQLFLFYCLLPYRLVLTIGRNIKRGESGFILQQMRSLLNLIAGRFR